MLLVVLSGDGFFDDRSIGKLYAVRGFPGVGRNHLDSVPGAAVEERSIRAFADAFLAADAEIGINLYAPERRVIFIRDPEHAGFNRTIFDAGWRACTARAAVGRDR